MQIILLERVANLGQMGDEVTVRAGYARNFLLPQGKALRATKENRSRFEAERAQIEARNLEARKEAQSVAAKMDGQSFIAIRTASATGALYGSVSSRDIVELAEVGGFTIARQQVILSNPIKMLGLHDVVVRLHPEVDVKITLNVARSEDEAQAQARGEDVNAPKDEEEFDMGDINELLGEDDDLDADEEGDEDL